MNISYVHRHVPKDLTLSTEEQNHLSLPHLVVLPIEVRRTQSRSQYTSFGSYTGLSLERSEPAMIPIV
jgi:hypothetical protein